jgi:hypothetical protein
MTPAATAQQAVQWKVSDGGNGHWYGVDSQYRHWGVAKQYAESIGGNLATTATQAELAAIRPLIDNSLGVDYWLGASRATNTSPWVWVTGEPFASTFWEPGAPDNGPESLCLEVIGRPATSGFGLWNDETFYSWGGGNYSIIEWSADCNSDGIVDYGQILAGELEDTNSNGIPDCCDAGTSCDCPADIDGNGDINGIDLAIILDKWGTNGGKDYPNADIDGDGTIAGADLAQVLGNWGACQ